MSSVASHVARMVRLWPHWHFTYCRPGEKGPRYKDWNKPETALRGDDAVRFLDAHPGYGAGLLLEPSRIVTGDIDSTEHARAVLLAFGVELDTLAEYATYIVGRPGKYRFVFEAPEGIALRHRTLAWPRQDDPRKGFAVFELRAGLVSDMLPPSLHAITKQPYTWHNAPRDGFFPTLPPELLRLWVHWDERVEEMRAMCPWYVAPELRKPSPRPADRANQLAPVISQFNATHDPVRILIEHGYRKVGKRYAAPGSSHAAGVTVLGDGKRVFSHHAGDILGGGKACDAFDCYRILQHNGDFTAAVRAAAAELGIERRRA